jgi:hypothetical protein
MAALCKDLFVKARGVSNSVGLHPDTYAKIRECWALLDTLIAQARKEVQTDRIDTHTHATLRIGDAMRSIFEQEHNPDSSDSK